MTLPVAFPRSGHSLRVKTRRTSAIPMLQTVISHALVGILCLYLGYGVGTIQNTRVTSECSGSTIETSTDTVVIPSVPSKRNVDSQHEKLSRTSPFPNKISKLVYDFATIPRDSFNELIDVGVPYDDTVPGSEDVLLLYTNPKSLPNGTGLSDDKISMDPQKAMENCHTVKVLLHAPSNRQQKYSQCIAIVPQWESFIVHKFMRVKSLGSPADLSEPFTYVPRSQKEEGSFEGIPKMKIHTQPSYKGLVEYLQNYDRILEELKPLFQGAMNVKKDKSRIIVVLTCNKGQSELFRNFVCNARAKGLNLSHVVMFATDLDTHKLSQELGISSYYDESIFGDMPEQAANRYADMIFTRMMMAKIYCVHLALTSGYSVLFQDVDVVWYKNPLPYLESDTFSEFDMVFQDDGSRQARFSPYSPNSGFYYVRRNDKTLLFFATFLRKGDVLLQAKSHQEVVTSLLNEFTSTHGLRVKVVKKGMNNNFPGGSEFHNSKDFMREMILGKRKPFIFHMSWTENKENKKKYFEQLGEWYAMEDVESCVGLDCCLPQPNITCHYKDKPSKVPCPHSPHVVEGKGKSFW
ncbi:nucleotide-diphospho-sugar transferase [Nitzschia inconspicua]|uniref:Nucleotide-diphospho-sugar transferase n=1 Tax=Nitzschia inconspicua TaxID=303405 RepID=A0A9K3LSL3_9STRA|nr:nucleotide-diphospho-sugar transferase [Nitzschia inconspicua]